MDVGPSIISPAKQILSKRIATSNRLLPPAPAGSGALSDQRRKLWLDVMKPMTSSANGREVVHLKAFGRYVLSARDAALAEAYGTAEPAARRAAVADWLYWRHVGELLERASPNS